MSVATIIDPRYKMALTRFCFKKIFDHDEVEREVSRISTFLCQVVDEYGSKNSGAEDRGKFAHLAIMVDLNAPLVPCVGIDGFVQKLEYEGLQHICYGCGVYRHAKDSCPKTNPKRASKGVVNGSSSSSNAISTTNKEPEELFWHWMTVDNRWRRSGNKMLGDRNKSLTIVVAEGSRFAALKLDVTETIPIVVADIVAPSPRKVLADAGLGQPSSSPARHVQPHGVGRNAAYLAFNPSRKSKASSSVDTHSKVLPMVPDNVQAQLNSIAMHKELTPAGTSKLVINHDGLLEVQPSIPVLHRENGVTVVPSLVNYGREVVSNYYLRSFKLDFGPKLLALFEPCASGRVVDRVISKFRFPHSFRVEAQGFSAGIWLCWKTMFPNSSKHMALWEELVSLDPGEVPWFVRDDFNVILNPEEHRGGSGSNVNGR
ncbi:hypothetical protein GQ457_17G008060 [Hibiscus cannabinus]